MPYRITQCYCDLAEVTFHTDCVKIQLQVNNNLKTADSGQTDNLISHIDMRIHDGSTLHNHVTLTNDLLICRLMHAEQLPCMITSTAQAIFLLEHGQTGHTHRKSQMLRITLPMHQHGNKCRKLLLTFHSDSSHSIRLSELCKQRPSELHQRQQMQPYYTF